MNHAKKILFLNPGLPNYSRARSSGLVDACNFLQQYYIFFYFFKKKVDQQEQFVNIKTIGIFCEIYRFGNGRYDWMIQNTDLKLAKR